MATLDLFRARLAHLIDPRHPQAVLATRIPWVRLEVAMTPLLARTTTSAEDVPTIDLFGAAPLVADSPSPAGRPRLPVRWMLSLLYL
jgi:transposase, IS5 family